MTDIRNYKETVKAAVAAEREKDQNWSWSVNAINKNIVRIGWGYLDYIGSKDFFTVEIIDNESDEPTVVGTIPNGNKVYCFIGPKHWHDCKTIESGITSVIHKMASSAHRTY